MANDMGAVKLYEAGRRLQMNHLKLSEAFNLYHRAISEMNLKEDDNSRCLVAGVALYVILKYYSTTFTLEQLCIVLYKTIHDVDVDFVEQLQHEDSELVKLIDGIKFTEWTVMRAVSFEIIEEVPIKFLLPYLRMMVDVLPRDVYEDFNFSKACCALVLNFMKSPDCIKFDAGHIALCAIALILRASNESFPGYKDQHYTAWIKLFCDVQEDELKTICKAMQKGYELCPSSLTTPL